MRRWWMRGGIVLWILRRIGGMMRLLLCCWIVGLMMRSRSCFPDSISGLFLRFVHDAFTSRGYWIPHDVSWYRTPNSDLALSLQIFDIADIYLLDLARITFQTSHVMIP